MDSPSRGSRDTYRDVLPAQKRYRPPHFDGVFGYQRHFRSMLSKDSTRALADGAPVPATVPPSALTWRFMLCLRALFVFLVGSSALAVTVKGTIQDPSGAFVQTRPS